MLLCSIQFDVKATLRIARDDLPSVSISRLRALDIITVETTQFLVRLDEVEQLVGVKLRRFPNGGSWSLFVCPTCNRWVRTLRLHLEDIVCPGCCKQRGIRPRGDPLSVRQRAELRVPKLQAMLESETSLRLKPVLWGKLERRSRHEAALAKAEFILNQPYGRYRDVLKQTQAMEIEPEPIARPKIKSPRKR